MDIIYCQYPPFYHKGRMFFTRLLDQKKYMTPFQRSSVNKLIGHMIYVCDNDGVLDIAILARDKTISNYNMLDIALLNCDIYLIKCLLKIDKKYNKSEWEDRIKMNLNLIYSDPKNEYKRNKLIKLINID